MESHLVAWAARNRSSREQVWDLDQLHMKEEQLGMVVAEAKACCVVGGQLLKAVTVPSLWVAELFRSPRMVFTEFWCSSCAPGVADGWL